MVQYGTPKKKARKELKRHASTEEDSALFVAILPNHTGTPGKLQVDFTGRISDMDNLEARSRDVQERTFCKWLNTKLEAHGYEPMTSLVKDFRDGVKLIQLLEIMGDAALGRYNKNPKIRVQRAENATLALEFIQSRGVKLTNIGPEDIIDGNLKLILGLIWTLVLRFTIAEISEEGKSAKEGLLLWCQRKTDAYKEVEVTDFTWSWTDGLALCALIHCHRPDLIDYDALDKSDVHGNTRLAFKVASEHLGIPQLLEVEDLCDKGQPDERSVMTYIASYFHAFSTMDQAETVSRRIEKFAELMYTIWLSRNDYEQRCRKLMNAISQCKTVWTSTSFNGSYSDAKDLAAALQGYKKTAKREWVTEKQDLLTLYGNVQTKLKTYKLRPWEPEPELRPESLDAAWTSLIESEAKHSSAINSMIREIKEALRKQFANMANSFYQKLRELSAEVSAIDGKLEDQQAVIQTIEAKIPALEARLAEVAAAEERVVAANVDENDYTVFTFEDLKFELDLVVQSITKKSKFIENQIVSRNMTNLTPAQLEQFESTFRYFDKDTSGTLTVEEMAAALASLGIVYSDDDLDIIYDQLVAEYGSISFEAWINLLVDIMEDQVTPEQVRESFQGISNDKPYITELDLRKAKLPAATINYLKDAIPQVTFANGNSTNKIGELAYDFDGWLDELFDLS